MDKWLKDVKVSQDGEFHKGVAEPSRPSEFLLKILGSTPDAEYTSDELLAAQSRKRGLIQRAFTQIGGITADIAAVYKKVSKEAGFNPGRLRIYIAGGRTGKPLKSDSDLDMVLTVENPDSAIFYLGDRSPRLGPKNEDAARLLAEALKPIWEKYGLYTREHGKISDDNLFVDIFFGGSEEYTRKDWAKDSESPDMHRAAVLVHKE